jgi:hypothetical protein
VTHNDKRTTLLRLTVNYDPKTFVYGKDGNYKNSKGHKLVTKVIRTQCYKTFYGLNLQMFALS